MISVCDLSLHVSAIDAYDLTNIASNFESLAAASVSASVVLFDFARWSPLRVLWIRRSNERGAEQLMSCACLIQLNGHIVVDKRKRRVPGSAHRQLLLKP